MNAMREALGRDLTAKEQEHVHDALLWWRTRGHGYVVQRMVEDGLADEVVLAVVGDELRAAARRRARHGWSALGAGTLISIFPAMILIGNLLATDTRIIPIGRGIITCAVGPALLIIGIVEIVAALGVSRAVTGLPQALIAARNAALAPKR